MWQECHSEKHGKTEFIFVNFNTFNIHVSRKCYEKIDQIYIFSNLKQVVTVEIGSVLLFCFTCFTRYNAIQPTSNTRIKNILALHAQEWTRMNNTAFLLCPDLYIKKKKKKKKNGWPIDRPIFRPKGQTHLLFFSLMQSINDHTMRTKCLFDMEQMVLERECNKLSFYAKTPILTCAHFCSIWPCCLTFWVKKKKEKDIDDEISFSLCAGSR